LYSSPAALQEQQQHHQSKQFRHAMVTAAEPDTSVSPTVDLQYVNQDCNTFAAAAAAAAGTPAL